MNNYHFPPGPRPLFSILNLLAFRPGTIFLISPYLMHGHFQYYSDPLDFKPERWTEDFKRTLPRHAYIPFGSGPRVCIGEHFAWMEGILLLATIGQQWHLQRLSNEPVVLQPMVTLRPKYGMWMSCQKLA